MSSETVLSLHLARTIYVTKPGAPPSAKSSSCRLSSCCHPVVTAAFEARRLLCTLGSLLRPWVLPTANCAARARLLPKDGEPTNSLNVTDPKRLGTGRLSALPSARPTSGRSPICLPRTPRTAPSDAAAMDDGCLVGFGQGRFCQTQTDTGWLLAGRARLVQVGNLHF